MSLRSAEGIPCNVCGAGEAVVLCNGCEAALCSKCRIFDIWCHGCGSGDVKAFCPKCHNDPEINVYRQ